MEDGANIEITVQNWKHDAKIRKLLQTLKQGAKIQKSF